jgi:hypothetical protein
MQSLFDQHLELASEVDVWAEAMSGTAKIKTRAAINAIFIPKIFGL